MRFMLLALAALLTVSATAEAASRHKAKWKRGAYVERNGYGGYGAGGRFTKREYDRLPIRVTKPDNMRHYIYQDYPAWAAEAMQPKWWTR